MMRFSLSLIAVGIILIPGYHLSQNTYEGRICRENILRQNIKESELIILGEIVDVIPPELNAWSGPMVIFQAVQYKVKKVLKGQFGKSEISVMHYLVYGSRTANKDINFPELSSDLFKINNQLLLLLRTKELPTKTYNGIVSKNYYVTIDETCGVFPPDSALFKKVEEMIVNKHVTNNRVKVFGEALENYGMGLVNFEEFRQADDATKRKALDLLPRRISDALLKQGEAWQLQPRVIMSDVKENMQMRQR